MKVHTYTACKVLHFLPVDINVLQVTYLMLASGHTFTVTYYMLSSGHVCTDSNLLRIGQWKYMY